MLCIRYLELILESAEELTNKVRRGGHQPITPQAWNRELGPQNQPLKLEYLELEGALGALRDVLVEALLGIIGQLEGDLRGAAGFRHQQQ